MPKTILSLGSAAVLMFTLLLIGCGAKDRSTSGHLSKSPQPVTLSQNISTSGIQLSRPGISKASAYPPAPIPAAPAGYAGYRTPNSQNYSDSTEALAAILATYLKEQMAQREAEQQAAEMQAAYYEAYRQAITNAQQQALLYQYQLQVQAAANGYSNNYGTSQPAQNSTPQSSAYHDNINGFHVYSDGDGVRAYSIPNNWDEPSTSAFYSSGN